ncbi:M1 family metallopeptidase [Dinghuibacter silviterrae]|uniref:Peptidase M1 membrane alanine aminopeptidase domain-containing protein n=1 Tax=Dinghuibacter silviterrae TaxID=1539049 RepID=A0A4R8DTJ9_9BACT|nr:M1 family metallopeptidase [Dinghuibacter silviterrae]TDX01624.1 hypothetical protein EDB95_2665 [Dinghuibacter silviterrae]
MNRFYLTAVLVALVFRIPAAAQTALPLPWNIQQAVHKGTRTNTGEPGPHYWQNRADYRIKVSFDPATRLVSGSETITYINNSPDTLRRLLFKLYPNIYKKGVQRLMDVLPEDLTDGVDVSDVRVNGEAPPQGGGAHRRRAAVDGTNWTTGIPALHPGGQVSVTLSFAYTLNRTSHIRTGQVDSGSYFIAYFFPRIAVYDDIDGWNQFPYLGPQEFYNDFCHFAVDVTVPAGYVVWGTGNLVNAADVFQPAIAQRLKDAGTRDGVTDVIDTADLAAGKVTRGPGPQTWTFDADSVTDFVFALSNHYVWKASSLVVDPATSRRTRVDAAYNPSHADFAEVIDFARKTVESMSYRFPRWPYPYPHETVFDGLDQMEYPMMVNDNPLTDRAETIYLTDHEIFHTMFPFYMGVNETKYAFMDEGWATIGEWVISPLIDPTLVDRDGVDAYSFLSGREDDIPIITPSTQQNGNAYYLNSYPKPGLGYMYARDLLGDSLFLKGLHAYIRTWHGKHPIPSDFFACMNAGSGRNLDWFWDRWFYKGGWPDLGITKVSKAAKGWTIDVVCKGIKPVPVDLTLHYADGHTETIHRSVGVWEHADRVSVPVTGSGELRKVTLGGPFDADRDTKDNEYDIP